MVQVSKSRPLTPRQAARRKAPVDALLSADLFKALGDPTRLRLLACMMKCGRACGVTEVAACCAVDLSVVSRHLQILERAGVVSAAKSGRAVMYTVEFASLCNTLRSLASAIETCCPPGESCGCAEGGTCDSP